MAITPEKMATSLRRLGWIGFWLEGAFGLIPILVIIIRVLLNPRPFSSSLGLVLAIASLLALLLAMFWCFYYVLLARRLQRDGSRPSKGQVIGALWLGLKINIIGMICAGLIAMSQVGILTINMLRLPQGALIAPGTNNYLISASDLISVQAMINTILAQLVGMIITLLLLNQLTQEHSRVKGKSE